LAACPRPTARYVARKRSDEELATQLRGLAADDKSRSHGYRKYTWLLRRDYDLVVNHKRVYRVYSELDLTLPKASRRLPSVRGVMPPPVTQLNERWSVDFVKDRLVRGRQFRVFDVVEDFTSESMAIEADFSLPSLRVIEVFEHLVRQRGTPAVLRFDNGPEFRSFAMMRWASERGITLHFIDPGKPVQNGKIESFRAARQRRSAEGSLDALHEVKEYHGKATDCGGGDGDVRTCCRYVAAGFGSGAYHWQAAARRKSIGRAVAFSRPPVRPRRWAKGRLSLPASARRAASGAARRRAVSPSGVGCVRSCRR
jgi:putative transposase